MNDRDTNAEGCGCIIGILLLVMMFTIAILLEGCSPKIVERISYKHDTTYVDRLRIDSLYQRDSIFIRETGDTVWVYTEKIRDRFRLIRDTVSLVRIDSVAYETIKEVEVERPLTWWQSTRIGAFWWLIGALAAALLWIFRKPIIRLLRI